MTAKETNGAADVAPTIGRPELLVGGNDLAFRRLIHGLLTFVPLHEGIRDSYAAHIGLVGVQYTILQSIRHLAMQQEVNVRDVADHLHLSGSFVTIETKKLQDAGLIEKTVSEVDRRRVSLKVTPKGAKMLDDLAPMQRAVNDVQFAGLTREEFLTLLDLVDRLVGGSQAALTLLTYLKGNAASVGGADMAQAFDHVQPTAAAGEAAALNGARGGDKRSPNGWGRRRQGTT